MAVTGNSLVTPQTLQSSTPVQFANADGASGTGLTTTPSNTKKLATGKAANGSFLRGLLLSTDDGTTRNLVIYLSPDGGTTFYWITTINIPLQAGNTGAIANIDAMTNSNFVINTLDALGGKCLMIPAAWTLHCGLQVAVTSGKFVNVIPLVDDL